MAENLEGTWHYRLAYQDFAGERQWGVVEFYPSKEGAGGWTANFVSPIGDDKESLIKVLQWMIDDINNRGEEPIQLEAE